MSVQSIKQKAKKCIGLFSVVVSLSYMTISNKLTTAYADSPSDAFRGIGGVSKEDMQNASHYASPVWSIIGTIGGFGLVIVVAWQVLQTVIDLMYLYMPFMRNILSPVDVSQNQQGQQQPGFIARYANISDDMQKAMELNGSNQEQSTMGSGGMNQGMNQGMNNPMGGMNPMGGGGMGMNGMGMSNNPQMGNTPVNKHNTAITYLKNRVISIIILFVCISVLTTSVLTDSGIDLGDMVVRFMSMGEQWLHSFGH